MKFLIAFAAVLAISSAQFNKFGKQPARIVPRPAIPAPRPSAPVVSRVSSNDQSASVLRYDNDVRPDGYSFALEIDNGISAQAQGDLREFAGNPPSAAVVSQGSFAWSSPEGQPIGISYIADENGYQPSGDALPTPPPTPEAIVKALEYLAKYAPKN